VAGEEETTSPASYRSRSGLQASSNTTYS